MRSGIPIVPPSEPLDVKIVKDIVAKHRYDNCGRTRGAARQRLGLPERTPSYDVADFVHNIISEVDPIGHDNGRARSSSIQHVLKAHVLLVDGRRARLLTEVRAATNTAYTKVILRRSMSVITSVLSCCAAFCTFVLRYRS